MAALAAQGQNILATSGGAPRLFGTDMAVLEAGEPRKDLPCVVDHEKAILGFDLRFHAAYDVNVPLKELAGNENLLTILFRVTHLDAVGKPTGGPVYFSQKIRVPSVEEDAKGEASLQGGFDLGEGKYRIEWLIRDRTERVCSAYWDVEAALPPKDKNMQLMIATGAIENLEAEQFRDEPPVARQPDRPLNVKVLVNFAPQKATAATLQPIDTAALVSILRQISRDPRIGRFSLVAFNMHERQVLYKQENADKIDFPALGKAVGGIKLGTVDLARLSNKRGETEFLEQLLLSEVGGEKAPVDAVVFAGPKAMLEENVSQDSLRQIGHIDCPIFYMNYNLHPQATPWRDSISHAVKFMKGMEYTISRPRDLWYAVSEMVSQIVKSRGSRNALSVGAPSGQ
ncbi:MAG: acetyltransferase [Verrucomicrobiota bacterium]